MVTDFVTVTLLTRMLGWCYLPWKEEYVGGSIVCTLLGTSLMLKAMINRIGYNFLTSCYCTGTGRLGTMLAVLVPGI